MNIDPAKTSACLVIFALACGVIFDFFTSDLGTRTGSVVGVIALAIIIVTFIYLKRTFGWSVKRRWLRIVSYVFSALFIIGLGFWFYLGIAAPQIDRTFNNGVTVITNNYYGYQFAYPPTSWNLNSSFMVPGAYWIASKKDPKEMITVGYKDSNPIRTVDDLVAFAKDDAQYAKDVQGYEVGDVATTTVGSYAVVYYISNGSPVYYFSNFPTADQKIYVWYVNVEGAPITASEVEQVVSSFRITQ